MISQPIYPPDTMNSQDKVTISGVVFHVEETCRNLLFDYLAKWRGQPQNKLEEVRIAELLLEELKEDGKQVVTREEIGHLIKKTRYLQRPD